MGDFNGDSKLDLAVANERDNTLSVLLGNGDGTIRIRQQLRRGHRPLLACDGDFNGDSKPDLAVANFGSNNVSILPNTSVFSSATALASGTNPSGAGATVTFTATVTSANGTPTGTVDFMDGSTMLGSGTLNGSGVTTFATSSLSAGTHSITAVYQGDTKFGGSTSQALSQVVNPIQTSMALVSGHQPVGGGWRR